MRALPSGAPYPPKKRACLEWLAEAGRVIEEQAAAVAKPKPQKSVAQLTLPPQLAALQPKPALGPTSRFGCSSCGSPVNVWGGPRPSFCCVRCPASGGKSKRMVHALLLGADGTTGERVAVRDALASRATAMSLITSHATAKGSRSSSAAVGDTKLSPEVISSLWKAPKKEESAAAVNSALVVLQGAGVLPALSPLELEKQSALSKLTMQLKQRYGNGAADPNIRLNVAATELGVPIRRVYDVINVLEPVGILKRTEKLTVTWSSDEELTDVLLGIASARVPSAAALAAAAKASATTTDGDVAAATTEVEEEEEEEDSTLAVLGSVVSTRKKDPNAESKPVMPTSGEAAAVMSKLKRDPDESKLSMFYLTQHFVRLMLTAKEPLPVPLISSAIFALGHASASNTIQRRLYDIGSILTALGLLERIPCLTNSRTPSFRWKHVDLTSPIVSPSTLSSASNSAPMATPAAPRSPPQELNAEPLPLSPQEFKLLPAAMVA